MKWLTCLIIIGLQWSANSEPDLVGYRVYAKASTQSKFSCISTVHRQTNARVNMDGRRNWYFYVTARNATMESAPSNIVYVPR